MSQDFPRNDTDATRFALLDSSIQADIDSGLMFGGVVLVAQAGRVLHRREFGEVAPGRPAAPGDKYFLQSMSKAFTSILVLRAIEAGLFSADTPIVDLWPEFGRHGKHTVTIGQLLCHTGGLPTTPVAPPLPQTALGELRRQADAIAELHLVYEPGTRCAYTSGTGYDALGRVLELTDPAGRRFKDIAHEELFEPMGVPGITFGLATDDPQRVPVRWTESQRSPVTPVMEYMFNDLFDSDHEAPCAGALANIDDLFVFTETYHGRGPKDFQVLSPEMFNVARQNHTGNLLLEAIGPVEHELVAQQMRATFSPEVLAQLSQGTKPEAAPGVVAPHPFPAHFTWLGGYVRATGNGLTPAGLTATPTSLAAMGGGSTGWLVDTERDLTVIFLSTGMIDGVGHAERLQRINDLAIAAITR